MRITMEEVLDQYGQGLLNQHELYVGGARNVTAENIDRYLASFKPSYLPEAIRLLTQSSLALADPEPTAEQVEPIHNAVRSWLLRHPDFQEHATPGFRLEDGLGGGTE